MHIVAAALCCILVLGGCGSTQNLAAPDDERIVAVDFSTLTRRTSPNDALICPEGFCAHAIPDRIAPIYPVAVTTLRDAFMAMLASQPRTKLVGSDEDKLQYTLVQKSAVFRFPDDITVQFVALDDRRATLAIYSRSRYGYSDFGANRRRLDGWLDSLQRDISAVPS